MLDYFRLECVYSIECDVIVVVEVTLAPRNIENQCLLQVSIQYLPSIEKLDNQSKRMRLQATSSQQLSSREERKTRLSMTRGIIFAVKIHESCNPEDSKTKIESRASFTPDELCNCNLSRLYSLFFLKKSLKDSWERKMMVNMTL
jgi:hypothetical protein